MAKPNLRQFDYQRVAQLDTAMWRSYYNHQFLKMFVQLLQTMRTQLHLNWFRTFRLAYYSGLAATDYRLKKGKENYPRVQKNLIKFYKVISNNCSQPFDYKKAAKLELEWWDIHRYPKKYKKSLEQSLADAQAVIYHTESAGLKTYAHNRAVAMMLPNHEGDRQDNPPDWKKVNDLLDKSWQSLYAAVNKPRA
jgi:hypothetical protein